MSIHVAVIYYSSTGTNYEMAKAAQAEAEQLGHAVRLRRVPELAPIEAIQGNEAWLKHYEATKDIVAEASLDDLEWADVFIFSCPTRFGNLASQMKQYLDTVGPLWSQGKLVNKVVTAMASAGNPHGGQEITTLSLYTSMYHWGAIVVAPGYTDPVTYAAGGNPYGTSVTAAGEPISEDEKKAIRHQAKRAIEVASWMKKGQA